MDVVELADEIAERVHGAARTALVLTSVLTVGCVLWGVVTWLLVWWASGPWWNGRTGVVVLGLCVLPAGAALTASWRLKAVQDSAAAIRTELLEGLSVVELGDLGDRLRQIRPRGVRGAARTAMAVRRTVRAHTDHLSNLAEAIVAMTAMPLWIGATVVGLLVLGLVCAAALVVGL